jgi:hypothetical protein
MSFLALHPRQLRSFLGRQFLAVTLVDVGLPQPLLQAAVGNVELLGDRLRFLARKLNRSCAEPRWIRSRHHRLLSEARIA